MTDKPQRPSLETRIAQHITRDGDAIVSPRVARWLEKQAGMTADRRILLRGSDPDAYVVLAALHLAALRSDSGTDSVAGQRKTEQSEVWISTSEAAETLGVTDRCIRNWCRSGRLTARRVGKTWLINDHTLPLKDIA